MLQLNSQTAQTVLAQSGDNWLGGSVREAAELPVVPSAVQLSSAVLAGDFAAFQAAALELPGTAVQEAADEPPVSTAGGEQMSKPQQALQPEPISEQWLLGMLGQRAVQVEARDGDETAPALDDSRTTVPAQWRSSALVGLPMTTMQGAHEAASSPHASVTADTSAHAALDSLGFQLPGQLTRPSIQGSALFAEAEGAAANLAKDPGEATATIRGVPEPVVSQLPGQLKRPSSQDSAMFAEAEGAVANLAKVPGEATAAIRGAVVSQLPGQFERSLGQTAAVSAQAGTAVTNPPKIMGEEVASKVAAAEPLDGQALAQLERLSGQAAQTSGLERTLKLQAPEVKWGEQMLHALRETVELQLQQRVQHTTIRLDPPELGSLEIFLSHESGRLSVQISAAQGDVARLLQQTSERLRQELVGQNFMQVSVQVSADGQPGQPHERQVRSRLFDEEPVMAGSLEAEQAEQGPANRASDVLITV